MKQIILKEYEEYTKEELLLKFELDNKDFKSLLNKAKHKNILKKEKGKYKFIFVGLCIIREILLFIVPKYASENYNCKKMINILKEYTNRETLNTEEEEFLSFESETNSDNIIGILIYILDDFFNNGLYIKQQKSSVINEFGEINWIKTIESNKLILDSKKQPVYTELHTSRNDIDNDAEITNIHKIILNKCIELLNELNLQDIFSYDFNKFNVSEDYDIDYMNFIINKELNCEFEDRKINLLKMMINFINQLGANEKDIKVSVYGTKYFYIVWEKINSYLFKNQYGNLSKNIPNICWKSMDGKWVESSKNKIIPDTLRIYKKSLLIIDAKDYNIQLNDNSVYNNPGSYDIIKQYTYQAAFEKNKSKLNLDQIFNIFLYPKNINEKYKCFGFVKLDLFKFSPIKNIYLSDTFAFDRYIEKKPFNDKEIEQFIDYLINLKV